MRPRGSLFDQFHSTRAAEASRFFMCADCRRFGQRTAFCRVKDRGRAGAMEKTLLLIPAYPRGTRLDRDDRVVRIFQSDLRISQLEHRARTRARNAVAVLDRAEDIGERRRTNIIEAICEKQIRSGSSINDAGRRE